MQLLSGHAWGPAKSWLGNLRFLFSPPCSAVIFRSRCFQAGIWRGRNYKSKLCTDVCLAFTNNTDSPETLKLDAIPHSLAIFQLVPSLLHQTFSQTLNKHPETTAFVEAKHPHLLLARIPRALSQSKAPENCARSEGTALWANCSVFSMGWNAPGGKDTVVLMVERASGCSVSTQQSCRDCRPCQVFLSAHLCARCPAPPSSCPHKETALDLCRDSR